MLTLIGALLGGAKMGNKIMHYSVLIKVFLILGSGFFAQVQPFAEMGISKAFDQLFTIGMMALFIFYMIFENKRKDTQVQNAQNDYIDLLKENNTIISKFSETLDRVNTTILHTNQDRRDAMTQIGDKIEKLNDKLNNSQ